MKFKLSKDDLIKSSKFKHISILISFVFERDFTKNGYMELLTSILSDSCKKYNTKMALYKKMYELYNVNLFIYNANNFNTSSLIVNLEFLNPKYVNNDNLIDEVFSFFKEVLFHPLLNEEKNGFDEKVFDEHKETCLSIQRNIYNKKHSYAFIKLINNMKREDELTLINPLDENLYKSIKNEDLYKFYQDIFKKSKVFVKASGDIEYDLLNKKINELNLDTKDININVNNNKNYEINEVKRFEEVQDISQSHIDLGFRTTIAFNDPLYVAYLTFSTMFGGMFNSTLSTNIREKMSLVYNISASLLPEEKIFYVRSANDSNKCDLIIENVLKELKNYQDNNIENGEELLKLAKEDIINGLNDTYDSASGLVSQALKYDLRGFRNDKEFFELLDKVSLNDIIEAAKTIKLDTIFILRGK